MLITIFLSAILLSLAMVFMSANLLFRKSGKFPEFRVGHNQKMKKLGITCVKHEELKCYRKSKDEECSTCGLVQNL